VDVKIKYDEEVKMYISYVSDLDLYSQGETKAQAKLAIEDAIQSFLFVAYKRGVLNKCLEDSGYRDGRRD